MPGFTAEQSPGNPALPFQVYQLALPPDVLVRSVDLKVIQVREQKIKGKYRVAAVPPLPIDPSAERMKRAKWELSKWGIGKRIKAGKNTLVFERDAFHPSAYFKVIPTGQLRKWCAAAIVFYPVRYNPVQQSLVMAEEALIKVTFTRDPAILRQKTVQALLRDSKFDDWAGRIFLNYEQAKAWYLKPLRSSGGIPRLPGPPASSGPSSPAPVPDPLDPDYAIITTDAIFANTAELDDFCFHKQSLGHSVTVVTEHGTHTVTGSPGSYSFVDAAGGYEDVAGDPPNGRSQRIRKWLQDNYLSLGIEYVLLIGNPDPDNIEADDPVGDIPMQDCWYDLFSDHPTDFYYSDLSGDWDLDGDTLYGEMYPAAGMSTLPGGVHGNLFCVRWTGVVEVTGCPAVQNHWLDMAFEGRVKIWVDLNLNGFDDGDLLHNDLADQKPGYSFLDINAADGRYPFKAEYIQTGGDAFCQMYVYAHVEGATATFRYDSGGGVFVDGLEAEYFNDNDFSAPPDAEQVDLYPDAEFIVGGDRDVAGVDFWPEVFVGRIPFYGEDLNGDGSPDYAILDNILRKTREYEEADPQAETWRRRVLISTPHMYGDEADYLGGEYLKNHVASPPFWEWFRIHDEDYGVGAEITDGCTPAKTLAAWNDPGDPNDGRGVVMWRTHGWQTGAVNVFDDSLVAGLDDTKPSFVIQATCENGHPEADFSGGTWHYPLGYTLLRNGAVATFCSTRVSWGGTFDEADLSIDNKNNPYLMFYLAKGVFDNAIAGKVLAHEKSCDANVNSQWEQIYNYNLFGDPTVSLFGPKAKSNNDTVFLLDGTGSMILENKWNAAKDGAVLFYQLETALRHPAFKDRYNTVVFRWPCSGSTDATTAVPPGSSLKDLSVPLTLADLAGYLPIPEYCTPIGKGLEMAINQFDLGSEESSYSNKTILLLTDGMHNRGINPLDVPMPADSGIKVQAVGLGEDSIEPETIEDIATASGGDYRLTPSAREMEDFFCQILVGTSWKLQDVTVDVDTAAVDQNMAVFIVVWDTPDPPVSFELDPPGAGVNITPLNYSTAYPGMEATYHAPAAGETHSYYVFRNIPAALLGEWRFINIQRGGVDVPLSDVLLKAIVDPRVISRFSIDKADALTGKPIVLAAQITEDGRPLTGLTEVYANLVRWPGMSAGNLMAENAPSPSYPPLNSFPERTVYNHYLLGVMDKLAIKSLSKTGGRRVVLHDDGLNGDSLGGDGVYTGAFLDTNLEGTYTFKFRSRGRNSGGVLFDRTTTLSQYVKFAPSPAQTTVEVVSKTIDPRTKAVTARIQVRPRDAFGSYLGPFRGEKINLWTSAGTIAKDAQGKPAYEDLKNGSYVYTLTYPAGKKPVIGVSVGGTIVAEKLDIERPAQTCPGKISLSIHTGLAVPAGSWANDYQAGPNILADVDYHFNPDFTVVLYGGYNRFKAKAGGIADRTAWNLSADLRYWWKQRGLFSYFIEAGPGLYFDEIARTKFGMNLGAGFDFHFRPCVSFEGALSYHKAFDFNLQFIHVHLGVVYRF
ncbi:MAG: C25 family cysteine peptidase [Candidatus Aminicenantales bacterium]